MSRLIIILLLLSLSHAALSQADPTWLRHWNEAYASKPTEIPTNGRIAPVDEPGTPLLITGQVKTPVGKPAAGIIVHSYHRDSEGFDFGPNDNSTSTWRLQGWAITDEEGRFSFRTIRPAPDHLGREGAHIHFTLISDELGRQWAPKVFFADDDMVTAKQRAASQKAGEFGNVREVIETNYGQTIEVKMKLNESSDF